jgi:SAM-dependent methyltransferase
MPYEFVTLFDANFLPRGLVLYRSLAETGADFRLRVLCMDEKTHGIVEQLALPGLEPIALSELESAHPELLAVKPLRSRTEYCWTLTPASCLHALEREPALAEITYLDADLMFFADPRAVLAELGQGSVLLTPHRYAEPWAHYEALSGRFNVQFMTFRRDERALAALRWWHDRCVEWCYQRFEDGKFGDQKYLDDWPERFEGVRVVEQAGAGVAPWNVSRFELARNGNGLRVDGGRLVFFHYHGLHLQESAAGRLGWRSDHPIGDTERDLLWKPYVAALSRAVDDLRPLAGGARLGVEPFSPRAAARRVVPRPARALVRRGLAAVSAGSTWKSRSVAEQHRKLVLEQLSRPGQVAPFHAFREAVDVLVREFALPDPARLVDVGCGAGHYGELLERFHPGRFDYTGWDFSPAMIEAARSLWPDRTFVVADLFDQTLDLSAFDVVLAGALVDVLQDYERALDVLLGSRGTYVLLHRQRVTEGRSHVDRVAGYERQRTFASYLNPADLERIAARHSRSIARVFTVDGDVRTFLLPLVDVT